jgi:hypothetical protein
MFAVCHVSACWPTIIRCSRWTTPAPLDLDLSWALGSLALQRAYLALREGGGWFRTVTRRSVSGRIGVTGENRTGGKRVKNLSLLNFKAVEYKRKGNAVATDDR